MASSEQATPSAYIIDRRILKVRHLPDDFTESRSSEFLKANGAHTVTFHRGNAFAFFHTEAPAREALKNLHQLQLNGKVLLVTFARADFKNIPQLPPILPQQKAPSEMELLVQKLHAIAPRLGLDYMLNPMVKYKYPPITDTILANICTALRENVNFYTQVLHLMNKLNLPAPFRRRADPKQVFQTTQRTDVSTEMTSESGSDHSDEELLRPTRRVKRLKLDRPYSLPRLRTRRPTTKIAPSRLLPSQEPVEASECFQRTSGQVVGRKVEIAALSSTAAVRTRITEPESAHAGPVEGFGRLEPRAPSPAQDPSEKLVEKFNWQQVFTELSALERISTQESIDHPAFRRYEEGDPCVRLYVKNLHKAVEENDLFLVFGQFVPDDEAERAIFDIRIMKSGRMRGQAFITFGSIPPAQRALEATNRLIVKGKPIAVQFARMAGESKPADE